MATTVTSEPTCKYAKYQTTRSSASATGYFDRPRVSPFCFLFFFFRFFLLFSSEFCFVCEGGGIEKLRKKNGIALTQVRALPVCVCVCGWCAHLPPVPCDFWKTRNGEQIALNSFDAVLFFLCVLFSESRAPFENFKEKKKKKILDCESKESALFFNVIDAWIDLEGRTIMTTWNEAKALTLMLVITFACKENRQSFLFPTPSWFYNVSALSVSRGKHNKDADVYGHVLLGAYMPKSIGVLFSIFHLRAQVEEEKKEPHTHVHDLKT